MANVNALISERLKRKEPSSKMAALAEKSATGHLTTFSGFFNVEELTLQEKEQLSELLLFYSKGSENIDNDLKHLISITSEVKAINQQASLLHGERIKKAHSILTQYKEGAFTAWLVATYGNRQTPYNLWQYYEFYHQMPNSLRNKLQELPRQAIYSLASREGDLNAKIQIVIQYKGETKNELLNMIRQLFPLAEKDKRKEKAFEKAYKALTQVHTLIQKQKKQLSFKDKEALKEILSQLLSLIK